MGNELVVHNPFDGSEVARLPWAEDAEVSPTLSRAAEAFQGWKNTAAWERAKLLSEAARELSSRREEFVRLIREEAGKPVTYARVEVDRAIGVLEWAAAEAPRFAGEMLRLDASRAGRPGWGIVNRFPRGVILGITPFNFPLNLAVHKIAPALACGCSIVIKPSPFTPVTAFRLAELFRSIPGLVQAVMATDAQTAKLTQAEEIAMVSFTGSARIGFLIREQAHRKPVTLELGGNAWVAVLDDVPESAYPGIARRIANAAYGYAGQSCISVQNAAVSQSLWRKLEPALRDATHTTPFGDPKLDTTVSGPVINAAAADRIRVAVPELSGSTGTLLPPTLVELRDGPVVQEEIFGPVMTAQSFSSLDELIVKINSGRYGLQAGVYTQNLAAIERLYKELRVGGLVVNDVPTTRYDHQPYGGVKDSGQGREGIRFAMEEMTEPRFLALSSQISS